MTMHVSDKDLAFIERMTAKEHNLGNIPGAWHTFKSEPEFPVKHNVYFDLWK